MSQTHATAHAACRQPKNFSTARTELNSGGFRSLGAIDIERA